MDVLKNLPELIKKGIKIKIGFDDPSVLKLGIMFLGVGIAYLALKKFVFK
jgi:hypothetical protein